MSLKELLPIAKTVKKKSTSVDLFAIMDAPIFTVARCIGEKLRLILGWKVQEKVNYEREE